MPQAILQAAALLGHALFVAGAPLAVVNAVTLVIVPALIKVGIGLSLPASGRALPIARTRQ